jgi:NADH:ubiquinone reductase (H+-translocating)
MAMPGNNTMPSRPYRIVILGGGFGGLYTAIELERTLARREDVEVTLVNRDNFFLFTPMLHEVAASDLDLTHIVNPIRKLLKRVRFFAGDVESVDLERRVVAVSHGQERHAHELEFDHLVLALGSVTNFYGLPGLEENCTTMRSLGDAISLRNRVIASLEEADFECCRHVRQRCLTIAVAGGGFAGVETAAALHDFAHEALRFYPNLAKDEVRVVLIHSGDVILPELSPKLGAYAQRKLSERGVEIRTRTRVTRHEHGLLHLSDGSVIDAGTVVWTAGTSAHPILATLPCQLERGRVVVNRTLAVPGQVGVWAVGDAAVVPDGHGGHHPPTAQHAIREGRCVAANIAASFENRPTRAFRFRTLGQLASLGRRTGVANILGINFSGFVAWWLWRTIYLSIGRLISSSRKTSPSSTRPVRPHRPTPVTGRSHATSSNRINPRRRA